MSDSSFLYLFEKGIEFMVKLVIDEEIYVKVLNGGFLLKLLFIEVENEFCVVFIFNDKLIVIYKFYLEKNEFWKLEKVIELY